MYFRQYISPYEFTGPEHIATHNSLNLYYSSRKYSSYISKPMQFIHCICKIYLRFLSGKGILLSAERMGDLEG